MCRAVAYTCCLKILLFLVLNEQFLILKAFKTPSSIATITNWRSLITHRQFISDLLKPYANFSIINGPPQCVQLQCKIICVRTHVNELDKSIENAIPSNHSDCSTIEELCLYHNEFPQQKLSYGFLGAYSNKIRSLYIVEANITDIEEAAFRNGIFKEIYLEDLQLNALQKNIFANISKALSKLAIIQHDMPVKSVEDDFLEYIKYQLRSLTLQVRLPEITNITASSSLLNNLKYVDLSYNNFTNTFTDESFKNLWIVQHLDLSHSNIEALPIYIFSQLTDTLVYLNISHNKLITINHFIFGRRNLDEALIIEAHNNLWNCSCELRKELEEYLKQNHTDNIICQTPTAYEGLLIWDKSICSGELSETVIETTSLNDKITVRTTETTQNGATSTNCSASEIPEKDTILLQCLAQVSVEWKTVLWSDTFIHLTALPNLRVAVTLQIEEFDQNYGLIWFSKVGDDYYSMSINYDQYGLGCMGPIDALTIISNLLPNTTYTFCLIPHNQLKIPPFHCESVYVGANRENKRNDSLPTNVRATSLILIIIGVVLCCAIGITGIYKLLQYKPTLLKGSKRIVTPCRNSANILILPKKSSLKKLKLKEDTLAQQNSESTYDLNVNSCSTARRSSIGSVEDSKSYINANLYEVIPAYLRLQAAAPQTSDKSEDFSSIESYMPPLTSKFEYGDESLVSYAEVPPRSKRASNDPLPALPIDQAAAMTSLTSTVSVNETLPLNGYMWSIKVSDAIV